MLLIAPALWNGFPLLQYDTGGYLAPWYEHQLHISRSVPYGLLLVAGHWFDFWPVLIVQSALTLWVLALTLRAHDMGGPLPLLGVTAALCLLTGLPWLTAILLTDIFAGLAVLALYLLLLRSDTLTRVERAGLYALTIVSAATHSATFAVLVLLMAAAVLFARKRIAPARLAGAAAALALSALLVFAADARGHRQARLDAGRAGALLRPHVGGRHRQTISRRSLPRCQLAPVPLQGPIARRRRRFLLGRRRIRQTRPLRGTR